MSPAVTVQSIFLCKSLLNPHSSLGSCPDQFLLFAPGFYAAINLGSCGAISASFLSRDHGYWSAFLVPTCIFVMVPIVLLLGKNTYVKTPPRGSVLLETVRVIGFALGARWSVNPIKTIHAIRAADFWDPAKPCGCIRGTMILF